MSNDIEAILQATIQTKVIEAFNTTPEMIDKLVKAALSKDVNEHGGQPTFHDNKMPFMEWLVGDEIRKAITEVVRDYVSENKPAVKEKIRQSIANTDFGASLAGTVAKVMSEEWNWRINLDISEEK